ncbi:DUF4198 domain-containing protein [Nitrosomonas sp. HPC101]|uniref:DUF4198 domain-containing protein n=1 Tax=Nitrosomonas sp. HPC101 TaxID=1658667 RepID=UPI001369676A|nr:DUF4198 domain-containing protein [Nitrosomonas sp. HPC101]MXS85937.1 DUF4198 domain-containing protein [Nitrosomonas sp. HPC101]
MKFIPIIPAVGSAVMGSLLGFNVMAHALWLESDNAGARLYFGEYAENLRETSPGRLDGIIDPVIMLIDTNGKEKQAEAVLVDNHFTISRTGDSGTAVLAQSLRQSIREPQGEVPSPVYRRYLYARLGKGGSLPLDIQDDGNLLRLTFMGNPVSNVEVIVIAPSGWEKHLRTDEKGEITFPGLEPGLHVIEAKYELNKPGEFEGKAYVVESHKTTLTLYR